MPMGDFTKATPSVGALTTGLALEVVAKITELESFNYQIKSAVLNTEGMTADALGKAIYNSVNDQASSMEYNGYAQIGQGVTQVGMEAGAEAWSRGWLGDGSTPILGKLNPFSNPYKPQLENLNKEGENLDAWNDKIKEIDANNPARMEVAENQASQIEIEEQSDDAKAEASQKLKSAQNRLKSGKPTADDNDALEIAEKNKMDEFKDIKKEAYRKQKENQEQKRSVESRMDNTKQRIQQLGSMFGAITQGALSVQSSKYKYDEANEDLLKQEAEYCFDNAKTNVNTGNSLGDSMESSKQAAIQALMAGIARANEIQG